MERDAPGAEEKWPVCQGVVPGVGAGRAYLLLPAPAGRLYSPGTGAAVAAGGGSAGSKVEGKPCQAPADHQGRYVGNHGCRPFGAGSGTAGDAPC